MSMTKTKVPLAVAREIADEVCAALVPACSRTMTVGSVRRCKPECGDVEVLCIVDAIADLSLAYWAGYGSPIERALHHGDQYVAVSKYVLNGPRLKKFTHRGATVELYITTTDRWGVMATIRTGPSEFSYRFVTQQCRGGLLPDDMQVEDGYIWQDGVRLHTHEEFDVFGVIGLAWIDPKDRR